MSILENMPDTDNTIKYHFPPLALLEKGNTPHTEGMAEKLKGNALIIHRTFQSFGIGINIVNIFVGPVFTRYETQIEPGVRISKIMGLSNELQLSLGAEYLHIEAPIPGRNTIGIDVRNMVASNVAIRDLLESKEFMQCPSNLCYTVGKDIEGHAVVSDFEKSSHLLVAGTKESGKTVFINSIIMSVLYKSDPSRVKLLIIDPKVINYSAYNGIPHLLIPVVTDYSKACAAVRWTVSEMDSRLRMFERLGARTLSDYNEKVQTVNMKLDNPSLSMLPQILVFIDDLPDITAKYSEIENDIYKLLQTASLCGIYLIISTQRPTAKFISSSIKSSVMSRVVFKTLSAADSKAFLNDIGAEELFGKGDMLFYPQGSMRPVRIQGAFVSDKEVTGVAEFLRAKLLQNLDKIGVEETKNSTEIPETEQDKHVKPAIDSYFIEAGRLIIDKERASVGMLQRQFKIGFNRAAHILDQLYEYGVIGEEEGTKPRKVLMNVEQFEQLVEEI